MHLLARNAFHIAMFANAQGPSARSFAVSERWPLRWLRFSVGLLRRGTKFSRCGIHQICECFLSCWVRAAHVRHGTRQAGTPRPSKPSSSAAWRRSVSTGGDTSKAALPVPPAPRGQSRHSIACAALDAAPPTLFSPRIGHPLSHATLADWNTRQTHIT